ncbi:MAG: RDD family protein [Flammeovirgaceae bacterium]
MEYRPKITDIYLDQVLTRTYRNEYGEREQVPYEARVHRPVKTLDVGLRFVNHFADGIVYQILIYMIMAIPGMESQPFIPLFIFLSMPIYYIIGEHKFQRTIGKLLTKSIVINEYGEALDLRQAVLRTIIRFVPFNAFSFLGSSQRGWHDTWSKTYVVSESEYEELQLLLSDPSNFEPQEV